ncbi:MAG: transglutaminase domain-containing protein [Bacteroidales bacterium]|nr:transglutaminase domain-containing protein [Bacteroidales bacterium]
MRKLTIIIAAIAMTSTACNNNETKHFITDEAYRSQVETDFVARKELAQGRSTELFSVFNEKLSLEETEALKFLYAYMPYSDLADYDGEFFLNQVKYAFKARDFFSWGKTVPNDIFRHFVLVYRVNNENLDTARMFIFNEIKDRIKDMSMYDAALEVNHWCHEKVCYRASDARTSAPLASIRTGFGRCGEESTFTVTALRAVGIPARQCYTPRWAHTDDNHAWVEVWVDGKWYFLGACEPDAKLDMGWFAAPSTRCMMVHSNAFGKYKGEEEINHRGELFSKINMLPNYTDTKKITAHIVDENGKSVENAIVQFKLYNYAEYYPIASGKTDKDGNASLTTGLGDLLIWASKDGIYDYAKIDVRQNDNITLTLNRTAGKEYNEDFDIVPPAGKPTTSNVTPDEADKNNKRLAIEDSIRNAYLKTFPTDGELAEITNENLTAEQIREIVKKSEGNYEEIISFLNAHSDKNENLFLYDFLKSLSDKDLRDTKAEILNQHIVEYDHKYPADVFVKGILPARIEMEMIRPWRQFLGEKIKEILGNALSYSDILEWTKANIQTDKDGNYFNCPISPRGVFELRHADNRSRDIFFVAACRSVNIPAYLDNATHQIFVYENDKWNIVSLNEEKTVANTGKLVLTYNGNKDLKPQYWTHYTIAKFENGDFSTFDYEDDPRVAEFPVTLDLEEGYYMLSTGNRYSDGEVLSHIKFFNIKHNETTECNVEIRPLVQREKAFYGFISDDTQIDADGKMLNIKDLAKKEPLILCFIDPIREPTKHILKEFGSMRESYEKWSGNILLVIPSEKLTEPFSAEKWNLPQQTIIAIDNNGLMEKILTDTKQQYNDNLPLIYIIDKTGKVFFRSEGYQIGTASQMYEICLKYDE